MAKYQSALENTKWKMDHTKNWTANGKGDILKTSGENKFSQETENSTMFRVASCYDIDLHRNNHIK